MSNEEVKDQELDLSFEEMMQNFTSPVAEGMEISDERLQEMNKKLPEWSLEPPYSFLK